MFDPDDKKRTVAGRSLLDFVPGEAGTTVRAAAPASGRPKGRGSLLDHLHGIDDEPAKVPSQGKVGGAEATLNPAHQPSESAQGKISGWLMRVVAPNDGQRLPNGSPHPADGTQAEAIPAPAADWRERPLVDIATVLTSVWQLRRLIAATTVLGAIGGVLLAVSTPSVYVSESKLYVDPREVRLTDSDLSKESLATEAILALVDSQLEVLRSRTVLEKVAVDMGLDRDPEFGGSASTSGGLSAGLDVIRDLASQQKAKPLAASGVNPRTLERLSEAVTVSRDPKTFIVTVEVETRDAAKSALIANRIVSTFLSEEQAAQSGFFQRTTAALDSRLAELRGELDRAEKAVEKYKADNDIVGADGELISDKQLLSLNDQVAAVRSRIADARAKADVANRVKLNEVLTGAFPEEIGSVTLQELRKQYSTARAQLGALEASLGPRHPQRLAATQSLEVARSEIGNELRRIEAATQTELQRALATEKDLLQQLAVRKAKQVNSSTGFIELRELERKAAATRTIYESFLKRASETGEEEKLTSRNIRVISSAEPPLQPKGPSRKLIAIGGMIAGLMVGIGLGVALGLYRNVAVLLPSSATRPGAVPISDPPEGGGDPGARRARSKPVREPAPVHRSPIPSLHHASASTVARSAFSSNGEPDAAIPDADFSKVRQDLHALRSRVEVYARLRTGG